MTARSASTSTGSASHLGEASVVSLQERIAPGRGIDVPGAFNVRDLGGLPTSDGRTTKWRRLIRADLLSGLPGEALEVLCAYGVRTVVDLRTTEETHNWPCSLADDARFDYHHRNLEGDEPVPGYDLSREDLANSYAALLASRGPAVREVFATLAGHTGAPAVFFCGGGTDRTGMIAALVLGLAGVPDDVIADDYSLSAKGLVRRFTAEGAPSWMSPKDLASGRALATLARPRTMIEVLQLVRRDYGGVTAYLRRVGVTAVNGLRDSLVG